jgi:hypothetical protein
MTNQATLSPIDPSINHTLAPQVVGAPIGTRASVSVEAIKGYLKSVTRSEIGNTSDLANAPI